MLLKVFVACHSSQLPEQKEGLFFGLGSTETKLSTLTIEEPKTSFVHKSMNLCNCLNKSSKKTLFNP